ncbi:MAG: shikimate kinase [Limisphaerales bacterium]|jgi:shikimate kinase
MTRIYLMGFMGCGKTTLGKKLARRAGLDFYDLDDLIEEKKGLSVPEVFAEYGESYFRDIEKETLEETESLGNVLIALGGGTPCFSSNMDWIKENGISIYLKLPEAMLYGRLKMLRKGRPLLEGMDDLALKEYIKEALSRRTPFYDRADYIINPTKTKEQEIVDLIKAKLNSAQI